MSCLCHKLNVHLFAASELVGSDVLRRNCGKKRAEVDVLKKKKRVEQRTASALCILKVCRVDVVNDWWS